MDDEELDEHLQRLTGELPAHPDILAVQAKARTLVQRRRLAAVVGTLAIVMLVVAVGAFAVQNGPGGRRVDVVGSAGNPDPAASLPAVFESERGGDLLRVSAPDPAFDHDARCSRSTSVSVYRRFDRGKSAHPVEDTHRFDVALGRPSGEDVEIVVSGDQAYPYLVARVGPEVAELSVVTSSSGTVTPFDEATPSHGWVALRLPPAQPVAVDVATRSHSTRRFFLADAADPCTPSPRNGGTPSCGSGQVAATLDFSAAAGTQLATLRLDPVGVTTCRFTAVVVADMRFIDGSLDGPTQPVQVDWLLPRTVTWPLGHGCTTRERVLRVVVAGQPPLEHHFPGTPCGAAGSSGASDGTGVLAGNDQ